MKKSTMKWIAVALSLWMSGCGAWKIGPTGSRDNPTVRISTSSDSTSSDERVPISREALRQCELDAAKADRFDEAQAESEKAKRRESRMEGALRECREQKDDEKAARTRRDLALGAVGVIVLVETIILAVDATDGAVGD